MFKSIEFRRGTEVMANKMPISENRGSAYADRMRSDRRGNMMLCHELCILRSNGAHHPARLGSARLERRACRRDMTGAGAIELAGARVPKFLTAGAREVQYKFNRVTL